MHPQPRVQCVESTRVSHHRSTGTPGIPARNGFNGFLRALPGDRACLSPSSSGYGFVRARSGRHASAGLDAGVEASGPHDFAVRGKHLSSARRSIAHRFIKPALRSRTCQTLPRPPHPVPNVRDDRETPLCGNRTARLLNLIWVRREQKYFCKWDWTGQIRLIRFNKSRFSKLRATTDQRLAEADGASAPSGSLLRNEQLFSFLG